MLLAVVVGSEQLIVQNPGPAILSYFALSPGLFVWVILVSQIRSLTTQAWGSELLRDVRSLWTLAAVGYVEGNQ